LDADALARLMEHPWPGNVRELENAIERAVVLSNGPTIRAEDILLRPPRTSSTGTRSLNLRENVEWIERDTIRRALATSTIKRQAARAMGITPRALAYYLHKYPALDQRRDAAQ